MSDRETWIKVGKYSFVGLWILIAGSCVWHNSTRQARLPSPVAKSSPSFTKVSQSNWDGSVAPVKRWIKRHAKDPESIEFIEWSKLKPTIKGYEVTVKYRAKNSFGAYVIDRQTFLLDNAGNVLNVTP